MKAANNLLVDYFLLACETKARIRFLEMAAESANSNFVINKSKYKKLIFNDFSVKIKKRELLLKQKYYNYLHFINLLENDGNL